MLTQLDPMMELIFDIPGQAAALCEDAIVATIYALQCFLDPTPQEAAWAARRSYEATDKLAIEAFGFPDSKDAETRLLSHPLIQQERARQAADLTLRQAASHQSAVVKRRYAKPPTALEISATVSPHFRFNRARANQPCQSFLQASAPAQTASSAALP